MNKQDADLMARMNNDLPDRMVGNLRVEHFTVGDDIVDMIRSYRHYGPRMPLPGTYLRLMEGHGEDEVVWMSNTPAELEDHLPVMRRASKPDVRTVLITGLGLGCVTAGIASFPHIEQIDVVEYDAGVITLTADQFSDDERIDIYHASAYTWQPPSVIQGRRRTKKQYDLAWHDIWPDINTGNLTGMYELYARYRGQARIQGFWALNLCRRQWEVERDLFGLVKKQEGRFPGAGHQLFDAYTSWRNESRYAYRIPTDNKTNLEERK